MQYLYLILDAGTLLGPLLLSFDKKVAFYKTWKALFPAIFIMMLVFIPWDIYFTEIGVWGFNPDYLSGIYLFNLPIEEWLFFIVVPYACVFIYACVKSYFPRIKMNSFSQSVLSTSLIIFLLVLAFLNISALYTTYTFIGLAFLLGYIQFKVKPSWMPFFYVAFVISLVPFLLVNGILTGSGIENEVVRYSSKHIYGLRIGTIPMEDSMYNMLMLLLTIFSYEILLKREQKKP